MVCTHELEGAIYNIAFKALNGRYLKYWDVPDDKFDPNELAMGIAIELEHTGNEAIAQVIAKAHLMEFPNYYTRLKQMEKRAKYYENFFRRSREKRNQVVIDGKVS